MISDLFCSWRTAGLADLCRCWRRLGVVAPFPCGAVTWVEPCPRWCIAVCGGRWRSATRFPTAALVTDIGNDVMYGAPVDRIVAAVSRCLGRLAECSARTVATLPPVCNFPRLSPARYYLLRNALFPGCRLDFESVVRRATDLERKLQEIDSNILEWIKPGKRVVRHRPDSSKKNASARSLGTGSHGLAVV